MLHDLNCGTDGAALGMMQAGFDVVGVDNSSLTSQLSRRVHPRRNVFEDAPDVMGSDFLWALPPCHAISVAGNDNPHVSAVMLIPETHGIVGKPNHLLASRTCSLTTIRRDYGMTGPMFGLDRICVESAYLKWHGSVCNRRLYCRRAKHHTKDFCRFL